MKRQRKLYKKKLQRAKHRIYVIKELINNEEKYVNDLYRLITEVKNPLEKDQYINGQETQKLFSNIESLSALNSIFLTQLSKAYTKSFGFYSKIADVMMQNVSFFKIYSEYL